MGPRFRPGPCDASTGIQRGADGGRMKLLSGAHLVQVIVSAAPLGKAMRGESEGDEVSIQAASSRQQLEVLRFC